MSIVRRTANARLVFLGGGEERASLAALARELELDSCVNFAGEVANPLPYMKKAAVLALSSLEEGLPTVLIEALAVGLPIVATDCPSGPREILCNGSYGTLVRVGDSAALAAGLLRVLQEPRRPSVPDAALERFRHDHVIGQYLSLLGVGTIDQHSSFLQANVRTAEE